MIGDVVMHYPQKSNQRISTESQFLHQLIKPIIIQNLFWVGGAGNMLSTVC